MKIKVELHWGWGHHQQQQQQQYQVKAPIQSGIISDLLSSSSIIIIIIVLITVIIQTVARPHRQTALHSCRVPNVTPTWVTHLGQLMSYAKQLMSAIYTEQRE